MGASQMIQSLKFNTFQKGKREKVFDKKNPYGWNSYQKLEDHKKLNDLEFVEFQKELFKKKKEERKRYRLYLLLTIMLTISVIVGFLIFWEIIDFDDLRPSFFQDRR